MASIILVAASCSKPVDTEKLTQAVAQVRFRATTAITLCRLKDSLNQPCDRSEYDGAYRELEDAVMGNAPLKAAVAEYGVVFESVMSNIRDSMGETHTDYAARQAKNDERLKEAGIRLEAATRSLRG